MPSLKARQDWLPIEMFRLSYSTNNVEDWNDGASSIEQPLNSLWTVFVVQLCLFDHAIIIQCNEVNEQSRQVSLLTVLNVQTKGACPKTEFLIYLPSLYFKIREYSITMHTNLSRPTSHRNCCGRYFISHSLFIECTLCQSYRHLRALFQYSQFAVS